LDVHQAEARFADLAGHAAADLDRHHAAAVQSDAAAIEQRWRYGRHAAADTWCAAAEVKEATAFEEKIALLRKRQRESCRLTCCSSTSTCAKSVFTVRSAVTLR